MLCPIWACSGRVAADQRHLSWIALDMGAACWAAASAFEASQERHVRGASISLPVQPTARRHLMAGIARTGGACATPAAVAMTAPTPRRSTARAAALTTGHAVLVHAPALLASTVHIASKVARASCRAVVKAAPATASVKPSGAPTGADASVASVAPAVRSICLASPIVPEHAPGEGPASLAGATV